MSNSSVSISKSSFSLSKSLILFSFVLISVQLSAQAATTAPATFGTFLKPFSANSMWNARPVEPSFSTYVIPKSSYFPMIGTGAYSTGVFLAATTDPAVVVHAAVGKAGVWDPDAGSYRTTVTIPHWPASVVPATGTDGHADIVDLTTGIVHSFFQLKIVNGQWTAYQYAWTPINGSGWGDPAHYYQGARAAGVSTTAGLIRTHEINDGNTSYQHALAMSLTYNGISGSPAYKFPATSADGGAATQNTGNIPQGALVMLLPSFDTSTIANLALRKVANTLKTYGAYVVDRNVGTPYVIYVENGSGFTLYPKGWDNAVAADLDRIRTSLRQVISAKSWVDGHGVAFTPVQSHLNVLSMRGPWTLYSGTGIATFDTWSQALKFPAPVDGKPIVVRNGSSTGLSHVEWAKIPAGASLHLTVKATGAAKLQVIVYQGGTKVTDTGALTNGQSASFTWPQGGWIMIVATSDHTAASSVSAELISQ